MAKDHFQTIKDNGNQFNHFQQFVIHTVSCFNPLQLCKDSRKLQFESLVYPRIVLHHILIKATAIAVFLLWQARQGNRFVDEFVFFGRYSKTHRDVSPTVFVISVLS